MIYAYTSTVGSTEGHKPQQERIRQYAARQQLRIDAWRSFSGKEEAACRRVETLVLKMKGGDQLITASALRLAFRRRELMHLFSLCVGQGITLHCIEEEICIRADDEGRTLAFLFGLLSEIEGKQISLRRNEGIIRKKRQKEKEGERFPEGCSPMMRLTLYEKEILADLRAGLTTYEQIARQYGVSLMIVRRFMQQKRQGE